MRVYIIAREPFPNGMAAVKRIICYAKSILQKGIACEVLIYTRTEVYGKPPRNTIGRGVHEGVPYRYIGETPLRGSNIIIRGINDYLDKYRLKQFLRRELVPGDIVLGYSEYNAYYSSSLISIIHQKRAKYIRELCELPYGTSKETTEKVKRRNFTFEKQFPICDGFIAISEALKEVAQKYAMDNAKIVKIPIMVDYDSCLLPDRSDESPYPYIFHSGTLTEQKDGFLGMIEAFGLSKQKYTGAFKLISTGSISNAPYSLEIKQLIDKYKIDNDVVFTGYLSENELKEYLSKATMVIINKNNTLQNQYCFSTKLGEYLAAQKPVIITDVGEASNWLIHEKSAYVIEPENVEILAYQILKVLENKETRKRVGIAGQKVSKDCFDYKANADKLVKFLVEVSCS